MRSATVRHRWGIEMMSLDGPPNDRRKWSGPLGCSWVDGTAWRSLPPYIDGWPASFLSRAPARAVARRLQEESRRHSNWRFRVVRLTITVQAQAHA